MLIYQEGGVRVRRKSKDRSHSARGGGRVRGGVRTKEGVKKSMVGVSESLHYTIM